jgi:hypothetical protein
MSEAMKWIVDGFVKLGARKELDDMKAHYSRLATELKSRRGGVFDLSTSIKQLDDELAVITRGLAKLDTPAGERGREA